MSEERSERDGRDPEGWEGFAEEAEARTLAPSRELEEAMREAAEAVEARHAGRTPAGAEPPSDERKPPGDEAKPLADETVEALRRELAEMRERHLRLAADFDNARKRALRDREEAHQFGHQNLVKDLLPSVDNLERAIEHARRGDESGLPALLEGVELVLRELLAVLGKHGVTRIEALGEPFDPALHEAMAQVPDATRPPNTVAEVLQPGYQLRGRLLRPARVLVSKPPDGQGSPETADEKG